MKIRFCGAAQEITGSCHLVILDNGCKILLDCGLYQGNDRLEDEYNTTWHFDPAEIDYLIVSHAHIDHTGRIPQLVKDGFRGDIYCTHATRSLCSVMLKDSAGIQERDAYYYNKKHKDKKQPLYTKHNVRTAMRLFVGLSFERWHYVTDNVRVYFRETGHLLGSASIILEITEGEKVTRLGFTGDIGRPDRPILRDPKPMLEVDYLLCESTYGHKDHKGKPAELEDLMKIVNETCVQNQGKLLIPAFSVGRTQEIVYMLDQLHTYRQLEKVPVYVDSPLAVNVTDIFGMHPECFDDELNDYIEIDSNPFGFKDLTYIRHVSESKKLNRIKGPAIIISSSGMVEAGRIRHHVFNSIDNPKNGILFVGYCGPNTTGGKLRRGVNNIWMFNQKLKVKAKIYKMDSLSAHGDRYEMLAFIKNQFHSLKKMFFVHGTIDKQTAFKRFLKEFGFDEIEIPAIGDEIEI